MQQIRREFVADAAPVAEPPLFADKPSLRTIRPAIKPVPPLAPVKSERRQLAKRANLPVTTRRRRGVLVGFGHFWVLHRVVTLRAMLVALLLAVGVGCYVIREDIRTVALITADIVSGGAAEAGFGVAQIEITGQALTREADVIYALALDDFSTTLAFDAEAARLRIEEIPSVETATIRKIYPDSIVVTIQEKVPVARWRIDGATMLIDAAGRPIAPASFENGDLMLVIGEGAGDDAIAMINLMERFPALADDLAALSRIGDRRWDMIFYTGLRVQLPENGVVSALERLNTLHRDHQLLDRDLDLIDMRVPQYLAVRPTQRDES
ncbi:cell division protein FtsQ/DivIB [Pelagibacterium lentulum]|uniref:Cell division protein FtsQ n=1 Tax=Pelagibacterium lentulum TaxID=2029865 RepID=A0A916VWI2_9HYPH|nr:cell division protein FtsQ/DivIB [Pelagibacterium lentulum]GGA46733.1 hypothetical protein GCM10011499_15620 [Pelagibacterium lentulum]